MVHKQLSDYILNQLKAGYSDHEVLERLIELGYPTSMVNEAHQHAKRRHASHGNVLPPPPPEDIGTPKAIQSSEKKAQVGKTGGKGAYISLISLVSGWFASLVKPGVVFEEEAGNASWIEGGLKNILLSGVIAGLIIGMATLAKSPEAAASAFSIFGDASWLTGAFSFIDSAWLTRAVAFARVFWSVPLYSVAVWLLASSVLYLSALVMQGNGSFVKHSYLISVYMSAAIIIAAIIAVMPSACIVSLGLLAFALFTLFPLTSAMRSAHGLSMLKSVLVWLVPMIAALLISYPMFRGYLMLLNSYCFVTV